MNVLFINQFFHPDLAATAQLLTDLTEDLTAAGVAVTVVTGRAAYSDSRSLGPRVEVYRGIRIYRVGGISLQRKTIWARYLSYLIFWTAATVRCLLLPRHDIVVPLTTPPLLSCLGIVLRWVKGSRVVCWSMDVYPELGVLLGAIQKGSFLTRVLGVLSAWSLRRADRVVPLGRHMARHLVAKGIPADRIRTVPTWEDPELVAPVPNESNPFRREHALDGRFVVLYSGNLGAAHEFGTLLDAANHLAAEAEVVFLFAGGGTAETLGGGSGAVPRSAGCSLSAVPAERGSAVQPVGRGCAPGHAAPGIRGTARPEQVRRRPRGRPAHPVRRPHGGGDPRRPDGRGLRCRGRAWGLDDSGEHNSGAAREPRSADANGAERPGTLREALHARAGHRLVPGCPGGGWIVGAAGSVVIVDASQAR